MLHATATLARRIDRAEIECCAVAVCAGVPGGGAAIEIGGGLAVCGAPGSPANKVLALGLGQDVSDDDLDRLEDFYETRGVPAQVELCPLSSAGLTARLQARGFILQAFENQLACVMPRVPFPESAGVRVQAAGDAEEELWLQIMSAGFAADDAGDVDQGPPSSDILAALADAMRSFVVPDTAWVIGWIDATPGSAGCSVVRDGVLWISGVATLPGFRRRGAQTSVVGHLMNLAIGRADLAVATVQPGSVSQRTFERLGFQVVYTRVVLVKS